MGLSYIFESLATYLPIAIWGSYFTFAFGLFTICLIVYGQLRLRLAAQSLALCLVAITYTSIHLLYAQYSADAMVSRALNFATIVFTCTQFWLYLIATGRMRNAQQRLFNRWIVGSIFVLACLLIAFAPQALQWLLVHALVAIICLSALVTSLRDTYENKPYSRSSLFTTFTGLPAVALLSSVSYSQGNTSSTLWLAGGIASTAYMASLTVLVTRRFKYLVDLRRATEAGADYDPISRTNLVHEMVGKELEKVLVKREVLSSVLVVVLHNLEDILTTHQRIAHNHAQFVFASRLRGLAANSAFVARSPEVLTPAANSYFLVRRDGIATRDLYNFSERAKQRLSLPIDLGFHHLITDRGAEANLWTPDISILAFECGLSELKDPALIATLTQDAGKCGEMASGLGCYDNVGALMTISN